MTIREHIAAIEKQAKELKKAAREPDVRNLSISLECITRCDAMLLSCSELEAVLPPKARQNLKGGTEKK